jgi:hypothetical protein
VCSLRTIDVVLEYTWPLISAPALPSGAVLLWRH